MMNRSSIVRAVVLASFALAIVLGFGLIFGQASDAAGNSAYFQPPPTDTPVYRFYFPMTLHLATVLTPCVDPPPNMAAWWPLDETSGGIAADIAGFPTNGVHVNGPMPGPGMVAGALNFDGVNDYVQVADHPSLNFGTGNLSIDAWIKTSAASGVQLLVDKRVEGATVQGYSLFLGNGTLGFQLAQGVGSPICSPAPGASCTNYPSGVFVANGQWRHVAVTVDRSNPTGGRFYVDGVHVATFNPTNRPGSLTNANPLRMASRSSSVTGLYRGALDEVELFPRVLSPTEVRRIYLAGSSGKCKRQPTPTPTPTSTSTPTATRTLTPSPAVTPQATATPAPPPPLPPRRIDGAAFALALASVGLMLLLTLLGFRTLLAAPAAALRVLLLIVIGGLLAYLLYGLGLLPGATWLQRELRPWGAAVITLAGSAVPLIYLWARRDLRR